MRASPPPPSEPSFDSYLTPPRPTVLHIPPPGPVQTSLSRRSSRQNRRSEPVGQSGGRNAPRAQRAQSPSPGRTSRDRRVRRCPRGLRGSPSGVSDLASYWKETCVKRENGGSVRLDWKGS